ncbi:hypothetical protein DPMN_080248 [Dreissena polymorpha]|uniref:Uncharacterized protein n=1 Tax=Dreissena polymorpha TaxID=45954 RepID=A0A9D4BTP1_DREPO|nr:hypothetical protein DPMN_080248 [Dreissena polymorpha]
MLVYFSHSGLTRTPLHMMLGHVFFLRDRSRSILTAFNRIGVCSSYQTIRSTRSLLASYALKCSEDGENPISSTFTKEDYSIDNSDFADKSSIYGTEGLNDAALVVFQDATVNRPLPKPGPSVQYNNKPYKSNYEDKSCQEVPSNIKPIVRPALLQDMLLHPETKQATLLDYTNCPECSHEA